MAYNKDIPQASDAPSTSQAQLLDNFQSIHALLSVDHVTTPFASPASGNQGKHNQVTLPEQSAAPTTAANEMALYTKEVSGASSLFLRNENNGNEVDITFATKATTGEANLPSGINIKWGTATTNASGLATVTFANAY